MEGKDLKELGEFFKENDLVELSVEYEGTKIEMKKEVQVLQQVVERPTTSEIIRKPAKKVSEKSGSKPPAAPVEDKNIQIIKSPISGTYYSSPSPTQPVFISVGDKVNENTVLCIIEAMKIMNEIKAECNGVVKEILVSNEENVQNETPLFKIQLN